jgi:hypothetical protein
VHDDYLYRNRNVPVEVTVQVQRPRVRSGGNSLTNPTAGFNIEYSTAENTGRTAWQVVEAGTGLGHLHIRDTKRHIFKSRWLRPGHQYLVQARFGFWFHLGQAQRQSTGIRRGKSSEEQRCCEHLCSSGVCGRNARADESNVLLFTPKETGMNIAHSGRRSNMVSPDCEKVLTNYLLAIIIGWNCVHHLYLSRSAGALAL